MKTSTALCFTLLATSVVGCVAASDAAGELAAEQASDGSLGGKGDGSTSFTFGKYMSLVSEFEEKELLTAVFQPMLGESVPGETGHFDLGRYRDDDSVELVQGTFKLYQFGGKDRIRLADASGRVLLRADWSTEEDTLTVGGEQLAHIASYDDELISCLATQVLDPTFEQLFNVVRDPVVSLRQPGDDYVLDLGSLSYARGNGVAQVAVDETAEALEIVASLSNDHAVIVRASYEYPRRGQVLGRDPDGTERVIATIACE